MTSVGTFCTTDGSVSPWKENPVLGYPTTPVAQVLNHHLPTILQPSTVTMILPPFFCPYKNFPPNPSLPPKKNRIPAAEWFLPRLVSEGGIASRVASCCCCCRFSTLGLGPVKSKDTHNSHTQVRWLAWRFRIQETDASALPRTTLGWVLAQWCYTRFPAAIQAHPPGKTTTTTTKKKKVKGLQG